MPSPSNIAYREYSVSLSPNGQRTVNILGKAITFLEVIGTVELKIGTNPQTPIRAGITIDLEDFQEYDQIQLFETAGSTASVEVAFSNGKVTDNRLLIISGTKITTRTGNTGSYGAVTVSNTATSILSANTDRNQTTVYNNGSNTIYLGTDTSVTTTNGLPLLAGASFDYNNGTALYGIVASGNENLRYFSEEV